MQSKAVIEKCKQAGISVGTYNNRIYTLHWTEEKALSTPVRPRNNESPRKELIFLEKEMNRENLEIFMDSTFVKAQVLFMWNRKYRVYGMEGFGEVYDSNPPKFDTYVSSLKAELMHNYKPFVYHEGLKMTKTNQYLNHIKNSIRWAANTAYRLVFCDCALTLYPTLSNNYIVKYIQIRKSGHEITESYDVINADYPLPVQTYNRLREAFSLDKAPEAYDHLGNGYKDVFEMAKAYGLNWATVRSRIKNKGMSLEEALTTPNLKRPEIIRDHLGIVYSTYTDMLRAYGNISREQFLNRLKRGWSLEQALTIPASISKLKNYVV